MLRTLLLGSMLIACKCFVFLLGNLHLVHLCSSFGS
jgi:hypothetical protein